MGKYNDPEYWKDLANRASSGIPEGVKEERMSDPIDRQTAIDALWKAMHEYEDKMEKRFIESDDLDIEEWIHHRIFVQNMSDIDRKVILDLPSAEPVRHGKWLKMDGSYKFDKNAYAKCSVCGGVEFLGYRKKYCPNCGAKMDGGRSDG